MKTEEQEIQPSERDSMIHAWKCAMSRGDLGQAELIKRRLKKLLVRITTVGDLDEEEEIKETSNDSNDEPTLKLRKKRVKKGSGKSLKGSGRGRKAKNKGKTSPKKKAKKKKKKSK